MMMQISVEDEYLAKFKQFVDSMPEGAITIQDGNAVSFEKAQQKVQKSIKNLDSHNGINIESTFDKVSNYS